MDGGLRLAASIDASLASGYPTDYVLAIDARLRRVRRGIFAMGDHCGQGRRGVASSPARHKALALLNLLRGVQGGMLPIGTRCWLVRPGILPSPARRKALALLNHGRQVRQGMFAIGDPSRLVRPGWEPSRQGARHLPYAQPFEVFVEVVLIYTVLGSEPTLPDRDFDRGWL